MKGSEGECAFEKATVRVSQVLGLGTGSERFLKTMDGGALKCGHERHHSVEIIQLVQMLEKNVR